ncbi:hypothetical protein EW145_g4439 [Phellinidium pouzarii]|uniref:Methylated-DNA--protein-cysteine methyltransferase n=1 Tax=Phellinidium pouzarii TaxID=167371 RepID=A0A4S4L5B9_9AGAM|nr:hypothetical protein EW145_g4439 [Phellinidium pouzarii]
MARKIPCGKVTTYKGLCQLLGAGSPRSVGSALRRNPFAPFVPCHRIIASDLSLGGFFGEWGTEDKMEGACYRKARMLAQEGVYFTKAGKLEDKESMQWDYATSGSAHAPFDPNSFPKNSVKCKTINREKNEVKDIEIKYVEVNPLAPKTIIMVHGWPGLWSNWVHQIMEFQDTYHIIAPDHRGFGSSTHPEDVESSGTMGDLVGDLACVLENAGVDSAICLGHDWGAQVCWEAARSRPDLIEAVAAAVVPIDPIPFMTKEEEDYLVEQYSIQGFAYTLQFYTHGNRHAAWEFAHTQGNYTISQPALAIYPTHDPVADWSVAAALLGSANFLPNLTVEVSIPDPLPQSKVGLHMTSKLLEFPQTVPAAHWVQLEKPAEFNAALRRWLDTLPNHQRSREEEETIMKVVEAETAQTRLTDEL